MFFSGLLIRLNCIPRIHATTQPSPSNDQQSPSNQAESSPSNQNAPAASSRGNQAASAPNNQNTSPSNGQPPQQQANNNANRLRDFFGTFMPFFGNVPRNQEHEDDVDQLD